MANDSAVEEVVVLLDSCFLVGWGTSLELINNMAVLREGVSILTASRGAQVSVEVAGRGSSLR